MAALLLDCTDDVIGLWHRIRQEGDPAITVTMIVLRRVVDLVELDGR